MGNSIEDWKRVPTTFSVVFGLELPYRPPENPVGAFLWRKRLWLEVTSGLSLLEPWEKLLTVTIFCLLLTLVFMGVYKFTPQQLTRLYSRSLYYLFGKEGNEDVSVSRIVAGWVARNKSEMGEL